MLEGADEGGGGEGRDAKNAARRTRGAATSRGAFKSTSLIVLERGSKAFLRHAIMYMYRSSKT